MRIDQTYSRFRVTSQLSIVNKNLGKWQTVSGEFLFLLTSAIRYNQLTEGYFDITVKSDLDRLGYDSNYSFVEKKQEQQAARGKFANLRNLRDRLLSPIKVDARGKRVLLRKEIEFGGFGKGFALDRISRLLDENGVTHYCINAGGDIFARRDTNKPNNDPNKPWTIALEHPDDSSRAIGSIQLDGMAIAGSAPNRRRWGQDGQYHHLINAKTRMPERSVKAIFVLAASGMEADGLATALFTAGFTEAIRLSRSLAIKIIIVSCENKMFISDGFPVKLFAE